MYIHIFKDRDEKNPVFALPAWNLGIFSSFPANFVGGLTHKPEATKHHLLPSIFEHCFCGVFFFHVSHDLNYIPNLLPLPNNQILLRQQLTATHSDSHWQLTARSSDQLMTDFENSSTSAEFLFHHLPRILHLPRHLCSIMTSQIACTVFL